MPNETLIHQGRGVGVFEELTSTWLKAVKSHRRSRWILHTRPNKPGAKRIQIPPTESVDGFIPYLAVHHVI